MVLPVIKQTILTFFQRFKIFKGIKIALLNQKLWRFCWMGGFCLLVELHQEGSAPAACAAGLFHDMLIWIREEEKNQLNTDIAPLVPLALAMHQKCKCLSKFMPNIFHMPPWLVMSLLLGLFHISYSSVIFCGGFMGQIMGQSPDHLLVTQLWFWRRIVY